ncbi:type VI secretion system Vgr family protein [Herbaspirillum frisingense]|uniref:type VI secretion system Vgr family protein n=1 Tax=Herbaspirillum frisingense TaxID=92645 RepID=UPI0039AF3BA3
MIDPRSALSAAFAKTILSRENRPIRLRWSQRETHFEELLLVQRVEIREAMFEGMHGHLTCISIDPDLPLHELLGQPLGIEMVNDRGGLHHINGIITEARAGQADGALRVYHLTLRDAMSIMDGRINSRIFRRKSVPDILHILLREWRLRSPALAHAFSFDLHRLDQRRYPSREISHQFNESDAHFIGRLCRREGIAWYIATPQDADDPATAYSPVHMLVFCDHVARLPQASAGSVRYHRDGATEVRDTISAWSRERVLTPGNVQRTSWDYKLVHANETVSRNIVDQGRSGNEMGLALTECFIDAPHIGNDLSDQVRLTDARMMAHEARAETFQAGGSVRDLAVGHWFELENHPDMPRQDVTQREFIVTALQQRAENNFPKDLQVHIQRLLPDLPWDAAAPQGASDLRYHNRFTCVRRTASITPHYDPRIHLPVVHPITALVIGPGKEEVYCDEYGRIKVQLQGVQGQGQDSAQGADPGGHERDSAFVRVSSTWAGAGYGHDAVPRVGMEVLLDFLGGDPDKMFVSGVLHNGTNRPARFSHTSGLPANRFISGIKTREIGGERYNQLRMDDTRGQISAQLASEHQHSQLNLGHLTEPRLDGHGDDRGQGLEARTDGHGVMRGAKGILITAQSQDRGRGRMLERDALLETLQALQQIARRLGQHAAEHHAEATDLARLDKLHQQLQSWDNNDETPRPDASMVAIDAPAGVSMTSQEGMLLGAQDHIDMVSQTNTQLSAGRRLLMRAGDMLSAFAARHMKLIAGKGSIKMQAHEEHIEIAAAKRITLSASEEIILAAPKISIRSRESTEINGGGSFSRWQGSLIEHGTSGEWRQQAGDHNILGPANCPPPELPAPPTYEELQHSSSLLVRLRTHARAGRVLALQPYTLFKQGKQLAQGVTDASGQLRIANHLPEDSDYAIELPNGYRFDLPVHETLDDIDSQLAASGYRSAQERAEDRLQHAGA